LWIGKKGEMGALMKAKEQGVLYNLSAERRVNNPRLWDDDECVKSVFDKLEDFG
jgi:hypothetical protein